MVYRIQFYLILLLFFLLKIIYYAVLRECYFYIYILCLYAMQHCRPWHERAQNEPNFHFRITMQPLSFHKLCALYYYYATLSHSYTRTADKKQWKYIASLVFQPLTQYALFTLVNSSSPKPPTKYWCRRRRHPSSLFRHVRAWMHIDRSLEAAGRSSTAIEWMLELFVQKIDCGAIIIFPKKKREKNTNQNSNKQNVAVVQIVVIYACPFSMLFCLFPFACKAKKTQFIITSNYIVLQLVDLAKYSDRQNNTTNRILSSCEFDTKFFGFISNIDLYH